MKNQEKRIVIIEDDQIQTIALKQIVERMGHSVVGMYLDPQTAIAEIPERLPDLILSDINLENPIDGIDVVSRIQKTHACPVIFLTGYSLLRMSERIARIEHASVISKPYAINELKKLIGSALGEFLDGESS
ncbi:MAG: response regulator [Bacteroidota bacterium]